MRVIITGAAGRIGSQLVEELSDSHDLCLIDLRPVPGRQTIVADLSLRSETKSSDWRDTFAGAEVVVLLAAVIQDRAYWEEVLPHNIQGTWNVIEAAAKCGVPRVVFASSNWAVKVLERQLAPDCYLADGPKIGSDAPPAPFTAYGLSKAFGEIAGRMFVDTGQLRSFVAVRIGNYNPEPSEDPEVGNRWIGVADMSSLLRRCVEAEFEGFHVVYGVSAQMEAPYDLSHTRELLSWEPRQTP
jgi:nucleoside-diphosphate-sugar epimerase